MPSISTCVGGVAEAVDDGKSGMLVRAGDEQAMANAICQMLENVERRKQMGKEARELVTRKYSLSRAVDQFECMYRRLVDARQFDG